MNKKMKKGQKDVRQIQKDIFYHIMCTTYNVLPLKLYYAQGPKDRKHTKLIS